MQRADKVGFVVAGAQKGGTTALDHYLREHPELCLPQRKELHFFDTDRYFVTEPIDYGPYHAAFAPGPSQRLLGEVTPAYLYWPTAAERIARYNPAMKL
ncbi:MAG: sulfotransferase, partial [Betaproteobacteria bacterium]